MNRTDFLRSVLLAPLAALVGCGKPEETGPTIRNTDGEVVVRLPPTWTCGTGGSNTATGFTITCSDSASTHWFAVDGHNFAGNYLP